MNTRAEIKEFLTSRRAKITPERAGLVAYGPRRIPGLRREEVAVLAGVSVPYYTRLERGDVRGVSYSVLDALARPCSSTKPNACTCSTSPARPAHHHAAQAAAGKAGDRPSVQHVLDGISGAAAFVRNERLDILAANALGHALYAPMFDSPVRPPNSARFIFLDPRSRDFTSTGTRPQATPSRCCAPLPAATPMTAASQTSSASSRPRATSSAPGLGLCRASARRPARRRRAPSHAARGGKLREAGSG